MPRQIDDYELCCKRCGENSTFSTMHMTVEERLKIHISARHPTFGFLTGITREQVHREIGMTVRPVTKLEPNVAE